MHKFDPRTERGYIVGYTARRNTFRVYLPSLNKVIETCNVIVRQHQESKNVTISEEKKDDAPISEIPIPVTAENKSSQSESQTCSESAITSEAQSTTRKKVQLSDVLGIDQIFIESPYPAPEDDQTTRTTKAESCKKIMRKFFSKMKEAGLPNSTNDEPEEQDSFQSTKSQIDIDTSLDIDNHSADNHAFAAMTCEPSNYDEAIAGHNNEEWKQAISNELAAHDENKTWKIVDRPKTGTTIRAKWVFKLKKDLNGQIEKYKARLVARGFMQREETTFADTFAPVAKIESFRALLAIAVRLNLHISQFDISTAFLYGTLEAAVYMDPPQGVVVDKSKCLKLQKALYGLKQSPKAWNSTFYQAVSSPNFEQLKNLKAISFSISNNTSKTCLNDSKWRTAKQ